MISYQPLWTTMKKRKVTKYQLIYHWGISSNTLRRMSHNEPITTATLNELCLILNCKVQDIMQFEATCEESESVSQKREEINNKQKKRRK